MPKTTKTKHSSYADNLTQALDQVMPRQKHITQLLSIGSTHPSPSHLPLWLFHCINRSYLPDIQPHCCQQQLLPLTWSQQEATKEKAKPPHSERTSWTIPIRNAPRAKHFPGPKGSSPHTALPVRRVPGSVASYSHFQLEKQPTLKNNFRFIL